MIEHNCRIINRQVLRRSFNPSKVKSTKYEVLSQNKSKIEVKKLIADNRMPILVETPMEVDIDLVSDLKIVRLRTSTRLTASFHLKPVNVCMKPRLIFFSINF